MFAPLCTLYIVFLLAVLVRALQLKISEDVVVLRVDVSENQIVACKLILGRGE